MSWTANPRVSWLRRLIAGKKKLTHEVLQAALTEANRRVMAREPNAVTSRVLKEWGYDV